MAFLSSIKVVRLALSLTVALWMAGAGCLLGCGNMSAMAAPPELDATVVVAANDSCAAMHGHDCCAKRAGRTAPQASSQDRVATEDLTAVEGDGISSGAMDCPMAVNASAALSKVQNDDTSAALLPAADEALSAANEEVRALAPPLRLPNRGHTYLRCCVFLI